MSSQRLIHSTWRYFAAGATHLVYGQPPRVHIKLPWGHLSIAAGLPKAIEYIGLCNPPTNHQPTIMYQLYYIYIILYPHIVDG